MAYTPYTPLHPILPYLSLHFPPPSNSSAHQQPAQPVSTHPHKTKKGTQDTHEPLEVLHEHLQTDVVREDRLASRATAGAVHARRHVRRRRVELREQEPRLGPALVAHDVARNREAVHEEFLQRRIRQ